MTREELRLLQAALTVWRSLAGVAAELVGFPRDWSQARDVDGIAGPRTRAATRAFQLSWNRTGRNQLRIDGTADDETIAMLRRDLDERPELPRVDALGWTPDDYRALAQTASELVARPADLALVLFSESGLQPRAVYRDTKGFPVAVGLNQITPPNARAMGIKEAERVSLLTKSPREQLPYVLRSFHAAGGRRDYVNAGMLYQVNFAPATLSKGSGDGVVMYRREQGIVYSYNAGLDLAKKGFITVGDLRAILRRKVNNTQYRLALTGLRSVAGDVSDPVV